MLGSLSGGSALRFQAPRGSSGSRACGPRESTNASSSPPPSPFLCRWLLNPAAFKRRRDAIIPAGLLLGFVALRLGVLANYSAAGATPTGYLASRNFLDAPVTRIALGIWEGLRAGWLPCAAAVAVLWPQRPRALLLAFCSFALLAVGLATAQDYSRSMTILLPVAVLGILLATRAAAPWLPSALRLAVPLALLLPAHHVMNDRVNPIFYLYHELAALENPPPSAMPEFYELRAIHAMERGDFKGAESDLSLAITLARNPASPAKQRGILAASQQRWADAHRDFSVMTTHDPTNPDAWFMRAQANLALHQPAADYDHARSLAPADWTTRPDVARWATRLNATPGVK